MAEFLVRGYNVAIPEVDDGDDVFVVHSDVGELHRVQIKTASPKRRLTTSRGISAQFNVGALQLEKARTPDLNYIFTVRDDGRWLAWFLITRQELLDRHSIEGFGSRNNQGRIVFTITFRPDATTANGLDLTAHRDAWDRYWRPLI
ncbi:MAG: hypothetical protein R3F65_01570 [bacterium]|nr:hypothetical protein [Myxococcales bacterium]